MNLVKNLVIMIEDSQGVGVEAQFALPPMIQQSHCLIEGHIRSH